MSDPLPINPASFGNLVLKDFQEFDVPNSISWWPQTIGWKFLLLIIVLFILFLAVKRTRHWLKNRYRTVAIIELEKANQKNISGKNGYDQNELDNELVQAVARILKGAALCVYSRERVAGLSGREWSQFLQQRTASVVFSDASMQLLTQTQYAQLKSPLAAPVKAALVAEACTWLKLHEPCESNQDTKVAYV